MLFLKTLAIFSPPTNIIQNKFNLGNHFIDFYVKLWYNVVLFKGGSTMFLRELSLDEFEKFSLTHFIGNFHESINYALLKTEEGFEYEFIGYGNENIVAAALILYKKIGNTYYGYSPRGFLIDYSNEYLLAEFTKQIKEYYKKKKFTFIKIIYKIYSSSTYIHCYKRPKYIIY